MTTNEQFSIVYASVMRLKKDPTYGNALEAMQQLQMTKLMLGAEFEAHRLLVEAAELAQRVIDENEKGGSK